MWLAHVRDAAKNRTRLIDLSTCEDRDLTSGPVPSHYFVPSKLYLLLHLSTLQFIRHLTVASFIEM